MRRIAWIYIYGILLTASTLSVVALALRPQDNPSVWLFLCLTVLATFQRIYRIVAPGNKVYESSTISLFAGALLLPPWLFVLMVVIAHGLEWIRERLIHSDNLRAWYIQPFNMAKCIISGSIAYGIIILTPPELLAPLSFTYLIVVLASIIAYVAVNQLLLGLALALARGVSFREAGIVRDAVMMEVPLACIGYVMVELINRSPLNAVFVLAPIALIYQAFMLPKTQDEAMKALKNVNRDLSQANQSILQLNDELFLTLAKVFDARDPYVGGHAAQVATYAVAIARELKMPRERVEIVRQSGYLHDVGKIAIPESILLKPAKLTPSEYDFMKRHSDIGADFVATSHALLHLAPIIRHHHDRWDGQGYPLGLAGQAIPLEARILNLCDSVEAMASDRPYHKALGAFQILAELEQCSGNQFDPVVVEAFIQIVKREGDPFIVNSARRVTDIFSQSLWKVNNPNVELLEQVYNVETK
jgi:putative nucleotidyltransferase with HDIG domain